MDLEAHLLALYEDTEAAQISPQLSFSGSAPADQLSFRRTRDPAELRDRVSAELTPVPIGQLCLTAVELSCPGQSHCRDAHS